MANPPPKHLCSFCARDKADMGEGEFMFVSELGGLPAEICCTCVAGFNDTVELGRKLSPEAFAALIATHNGIVEKARRGARS